MSTLPKFKLDSSSLAESPLPDFTQRIYDTYLSSLELPTGSLSTPQFDICPIGLVGSGKSTVMRLICERIPLVRIAGDDIRHLLVDNGLDPGYAPSLGAKANIELKRKGYNIAQDNDLAPLAVQRSVEKIDTELGITELWVHINPPEDFIIKKLRNHKQPTWLFKSADQAIANYYARKELHAAEVNRTFDFTFDPSREDLIGQVDQFVQLVRQRLADTQLPR